MAESIPLHPVEYPETDGRPMPDGDYQGETYRYLVEALRTHFHARPDVYVSGDLFVYLEEGNPRNCVAPDLFVVFGAGNHKRDTYKVWEEPAGVPDFVLEIVSPSGAPGARISAPSASGTRRSASANTGCTIRTGATSRRPWRGSAWNATVRTCPSLQRSCPRAHRSTATRWGSTCG